MEPSFAEAAFLVAAALLAGTLDAIAGGGGLITVPALMSMPSLDTHLVLGTNKGQSVFGTGAAIVRFARAGMIDRKRALPSFLLGFTGSVVGTQLALAISPARLKPIVVVIVCGAAVYLTFRPRTAPKVSVEPRPMAGAISALLIGCYDGFIGPGTGTFLIIAFVMLLGDTMASASANAKIVNFASNLAALIGFAWRGKVVWAYALPMVAAQLVGGTIGAHLAVRVGDQLVRRTVFFVSIALIGKVVFDLLHTMQVPH